MTISAENTQFINSLENALKQKQTVELSFDNKNNPTVRPLGVLSRLWHWRDTKYHEARLSRLADVVAQIISLQPRMTIEVAEKDQTLIVGRKLFKYITKESGIQVNTDTLRKQITAAKVGVDPKILDCNPGLQTFIEKNHIERYLLHYGHHLDIDPETGKASILKDGKMCSWEDVAADIAKWEPFTHTPQQNFYYGQEGVQRKDMYNWTKLEPYKKEDPAAWKYQYIFETCACYNPESTLEGNHSWVRLRTPTGDVYSVGVYRPSKPNPFDKYNTPFRNKPGYLMMPDVSEFWDFAISTVGVVINEEIFLKMKTMIENDKKADHLVFHLVKDNCLLYCNKVASLANVKLPTQEGLATHVISENALTKINNAISYLPMFIQKICYAVAAFFINCCQLLLGTNVQDDRLNAQQIQKATPHIKTISDLFDIDKTLHNHPNTFAFKTTKYISDWRKQEIEKIEKTTNSIEEKIEKIKEIEFRLPDSCYIASQAS